ncbi:MAG: nucleotidyl transferase AbiEii/AbiGii toxin family protein [Candidatus Aenigmarchaeota archaeon]|nr:nucleotidyl transferase AbiEii/AbiGii toxin family protein [Candidatus Aenigmarchaeota archaeon]
MARQLRLAHAREEVIADLLNRLAEKSHGFSSPKLVLIGGYALRAFVPLSRSTRDCDFALRKGQDWQIDRIRTWFSDLEVLTLEKRDDHGFMRCLKLIRINDSTARVSLDFMEDKVVGRDMEEVINLDARFEGDAQNVRITIANQPIDVVVPCYRDYFILKAVSARRSDIRDIAALVWKLGVPEVKPRLEEILPYPDVFYRKVREVIIPDIEDTRFIHSWRGTFVTTAFSEQDKQNVIDELRELCG